MPHNQCPPRHCFAKIVMMRFSTQSLNQFAFMFSQTDLHALAPHILPASALYR